MKKIVIVIAMCCIAFGIKAQNFDWGITYGLNLTNTTNSGTNIKPSIHVGAFAEFSVLDFMSVMPEIQYSRQGNKWKEGGVKVWNRLNYLNIPIVVNFKVPFVDGLSAHIGPQLGFMLNSKQKTKFGGVTQKEKIHDLKNFDLSLPIGVAYNVWENIDVRFRYNIGLTKLADTVGDTPRNSVIQIGVVNKF